MPFLPYACGLSRIKPPFCTKVFVASWMKKIVLRSNTSTMHFSEGDKVSEFLSRELTEMDEEADLRRPNSHLSLVFVSHCPSSDLKPRTSFIEGDDSSQKILRNMINRNQK
jgi:hypothetical protein